MIKDALIGKKLITTNGSGGVIVKHRLNVADNVVNIFLESDSVPLFFFKEDVEWMLKGGTTKLGFYLTS